MDILVTVFVLLAVIAAGAFLIHRLNSQHGGRSAAFHYGRSGVVTPDRRPTKGRRYADGPPSRTTPASAGAPGTADADGCVLDAAVSTAASRPAKWGRGSVGAGRRRRGGW